MKVISDLHALFGMYIKAINPCIMRTTETPTLIVGKWYLVYCIELKTKYSDCGLFVIDEEKHPHFFEMETIEEFFDIEDTVEPGDAHIIFKEFITIENKKQ